MFVVAIDTSSPAVTAAVVTVADGGVSVLAQRSPVAPRGHGELLSPMIAECLAEAGLRPADVQAVVAGIGPGPYTGLRVGLVTAAAFAHAVGAATYGVCSLDGIAAADADPDQLLVVTDARRREVYWARYDAAGVRRDGPRVDRPSDVPLAGARALAGAAVDLYEFPARLDRRLRRFPDPAALVGCALDRLARGAPGEPLRPMYLRRPDAVVPSAPKTVSR